MRAKRTEEKWKTWTQIDTKDRYIEEEVWSEEDGALRKGAEQLHASCEKSLVLFNFH